MELFECDSEYEFLDYIDHSFKNLVYKEDQDDTNIVIWTQIHTGTNLFDHVKYRIKTETGKIRYIEDFGQYIDNSIEGPLFYVFVVDVKIKNRTYDIDPLTNLPGKQRFLEYSEQMLNLIRLDPSASKLCFVDFNVRHFKTLNIQFGVGEGDSYLAKVAHKLQNAFPSDFVSRFGSDNFTVLTDFTNVIPKIEKLQNKADEIHSELNLKLLARIYPVDESVSDVNTACELA